jgi:hypothetical protein
MSYVIERHGWYHSPSGWKVSEASAKQYETEDEAGEVLDHMMSTTLAGLPGEVRVREARK